MRVTVRIIAALAVLSSLACQEPTEPQPPSYQAEIDASVLGGARVFASGLGVVDFTSAGAGEGPFWFVAWQRRDGTAVGAFRQHREQNGLIIDFSGRVTCLTVDASLRRARIGGVVTHNNSTHPSFMTENHQVGDDVWFRVQDGGPGPDSVDASTTYGFKPVLVNTSAEYCALPFTTGPPQWNLASIFPLSRGFIEVRP